MGVQNIGLTRQEQDHGISTTIAQAFSSGHSFFVRHIKWKHASA